MLAIGLVLCAVVFGSRFAAQAQPVDVTSALLTVDDLPGGWAVAAVPVPGDGGIQASGLALVGCRDEVEAPVSSGSGSAVFFLGRGQLGDLLSQVVAVFPPGAAATTIAALRDALAICAADPANAGRGSGPSGQPITRILTPLVFEELDDETLAVEMREDGDYTNVAVVMVAVRRADTVMLLAYQRQSFGEVTVDYALIEEIARRADERLDRLVP